VLIIAGTKLPRSWIIHHESLKIPFRKEGDFYDSCGFSVVGLERRENPEDFRKPTIWLPTSASEVAFGGEEEPRRTHYSSKIVKLLYLLRVFPEGKRLREIFI
jgi:hypothetical protein